MGNFAVLIEIFRDYDNFLAENDKENLKLPASSVVIIRNYNITYVWLNLDIFRYHDRWRMPAENWAKTLDSFTQTRKTHNKFNKNAVIAQHLGSFVLN